jgi:hypothetical protein
MNTETVLAAILPAVEQIIKAVVGQVAQQATPPTLYELEEQTQSALPQIGQMVLQGLVSGQGAGVVGPERPCDCGDYQRYHDQSRALTVQTSVGTLRLSQRAYYQCSGCRANRYPLDEQLGLGRAGHMSRYLQEQCGWLLALLPARVAQQTLVRFGWPAVAASQIREHGEALGAELEQREQHRLGVARQEAALPPSRQTLVRQVPCGERLYAAPDGVMYCTTERDPQTGKARWRELKVAAVYEARPESEQAKQPERQRDSRKLPAQESVRTRLRRWVHEQSPEAVIAAPDQATRVTYVAQTGPWEQFGPRLWAELWERGLGRLVSDVVVVADGADHIDQVVDSELRLPNLQVTRILDIAHAQEHLWTVSKAAFGEESAAGQLWVQAPLSALERGQLATVLEALEALAAEREPTAPFVAALARRAAAYFTQRRMQVDYPRFVAAGYQIGSGLAESACKRFGTDRMKGAGMRWTVQGAQCVATLRLFVLSERWGEVTDHCRKAA